MNSSDRRGAIRRSMGALPAAMAFWFMAAIHPAAAQSLFEALFGGDPRHARRESLPPRISSFADPLDMTGRDSRRYSGDSGGYSGHGYTGRGTAFCVRICDGRYFPLQRHAGVSPAELCKSFCPASKTMVFSGGNIDRAVAPNGARYSDLDNAFAYRDKMIGNCTCNGRDGLGLARLNAAADPTLRPGDIVANNDGLVNFRGRNSKAAEFTPIDPSSSAWARNLSEIKVRPAPPASAAEIAPPDKEVEAYLRKELRRAQLAR